MLTIWNAKQFLQDGTYVASADARPKDGADEAPSRIEIMRTWDRAEPVRYEVRSRQPTEERDWRRVVAVVVDGPKWQFKEWPYKGCSKGDTVDAFQRMRAIHLKWSSDSLKPTVRKWNVKVLDIDRNSRYKDAGKTQEFWKELDSFLGGNNKYGLKY